MAGKERVAITNVPGVTKRRLRIAALAHDTSVTEVLRERLPRIVEELEGLRPTYEQLEEEVERLRAVVESYQNAAEEEGGEGG
jgi:uncharacterized protein YlxW (UPF0749 family)